LHPINPEQPTRLSLSPPLIHEYNPSVFSGGEGWGEGAALNFRQLGMTPHPNLSPKYVLGIAISSVGRGDSLFARAM